LGPKPSALYTVYTDLLFCYDRVHSHEVGLVVTTVVTTDKCHTFILNTGSIWRHFRISWLPNLRVRYLEFSPSGCVSWPLKLGEDLYRDCCFIKAWNLNRSVVEYHTLVKRNAGSIPFMLCILCSYVSLISLRTYNYLHT